MNNIFRDRPNVQEINSLNDYDPNAKKIYFIRNQDGNWKPGTQIGAISLNENGDGLISQLGGDVAKSTSRNEDIEALIEIVKEKNSNGEPVFSVWGDFLTGEQVLRFSQVRTSYPPSSPSHSQSESIIMLSSFHCYDGEDRKDGTLCKDGEDGTLRKDGEVLPLPPSDKSKGDYGSIHF